jgi:hypothetical protein
VTIPTDSHAIFRTAYAGDVRALPSGLEILKFGLEPKQRRSRRTINFVDSFSSRLGLPFPAAVAWERQERMRVQAAKVSVRLSHEARQILGRPLKGQGGHQSFFRRLERRRKGANFLVSYRDFSYARERAAVVQGGWLTRYEVLLRAIMPSIETAGSVRKLFEIRCASAADLSTKHSGE